MKKGATGLLQNRDQETTECYKKRPRVRKGMVLRKGERNERACYATEVRCGVHNLRRDHGGIGGWKWGGDREEETWPIDNTT